MNVERFQYKMFWYHITERMLMLFLVSFCQDVFIKMQHTSLPNHDCDASCKSFWLTEVLSNEGFMEPVVKFWALMGFHTHSCGLHPLCLTG